MRILVLGGTVFLSRAVAAAALAAGHAVTCVSRGVSGAPPDGAEAVIADRSRPGALAAALHGRTFDAVVDVATMSAPWVRDALDALHGRFGHWTFVSSVNAYADLSLRGGTVAQPTLAPLHGRPDEELAKRDPDVYGAAKVASEQAVRERAGDRAHVVRGGLMCGHGDLSDRYGYWADRFARGGRVVVPDVPAQPMQLVDVDDLAAWIVACAADGTTGTHDGAGPRSTLDRVLAETAAAVGADDLELVRIPEPTLAEQGVGIWAGPRSLPLRLPEELWGMVDRDVTTTLAAGLTPRPLADTARAALAWDRGLGAGRERRAGLTDAEERAVLRALG
ncbi:putative reductase [Pseudonocardia sp. Ae406_Ps2]|uniref:NAD-dependent epimerase/dehydratase family protein n=1 Tax=unclassified Pseudonocardia TaxID=2619320 RepID=UPI00094B4EEE|nr:MULTISPECIES: NAD-dependent epimerase/dehydratase family protein [unclassified Pseudonocardia]OLL98943.1 putative reductase [Pseudonocardia sp. Ae331_Ps2]OLM03314.1 putative reductase [Pseudonocardia sp. Ae406_Ps2]OLM11790.1 putative reductase [Pseudonocardia sp. Ae505_Ps2]OLM24879.1 putative reductase [Pseudonocardia sp. Ae706_Ps2]OLM29188.1 putative reductase [Pseudonocardia sp. Ae717_Ps2]